ncbi:uncharacterized protein [Antedon mediterranea]|uniref:uncharacterized protein n=1 Tax=Antedon mediterranea TaxID=105859 RepID=UPI003AF7151E
MTASLRKFKKSDFESGGQPLGSSVVLKTCTKSGGKLVVKRVIASDSKVEMLVGLQHRNIVSLLGKINYGMETGLVFEYAIHGNLYELIDKAPTSICLPSLSFCKQATRAVAYIHEKNMTHRKIKSASFLVFGNVIKLADFNLSEKNTDVFSAVGPKVSSFRDDMCWMSPEVLNDNEDIDHFKSDVYSLAIVLWQLYHMQSPYKGWNIEAIFNHVAARKDHLEIDTECCQEFTSMLLSCWKKDPSLRLTANEMLRSINKVIVANNASEGTETSDTVRMSSQRWNSKQNIN